MYPDLRIGLITTGNLTKQFNLIFKSIGLNNRLIVKTGSQLIMDAKKNEQKYDIIIVDEAHKLKNTIEKDIRMQEDILMKVMMRSLFLKN